jgi:hypothetical protein
MQNQINAWKAANGKQADGEQFKLLVVVQKLKVFEQLY